MKARSAKISAFSTSTASWPTKRGAGGAAQMHALAGDGKDEAVGEVRVGRRGQPVEMADPRHDALGQHLALPGAGRPAPFAVGPVVDQADGDGRRRGVAAVAQVAQPGKAVQRIEPQRIGARPLPGRIAAGGRRLRRPRRRRRTRPPPGAGPGRGRPARDRAPRQRSSWASGGPASGSRAASPASSGRTGRRSAGRAAGSERNRDGNLKRSTSFSCDLWPGGSFR